MQAEIEQRAILNLATHFSSIHRQLPEMTVIESDEFILVDSGLPCDTYNAICSAKLKSETAPEAIDRAIRYFQEVERPFSWWVSPGDEPANLGDLLTEVGLHHAESELAMAADLNHLEGVPLSPEGLVIKRVRTEQELQDFARIVAANWSPPDVNVLRFYELAAPVVLREDAPLWYYVGYVDDVAVASAELTVGGGVVGLYNIGTLMDYRRRGYGGAITLHPLLEARAQGYKTAILQASDEGAKVYRRLGFKSFGQIREFKPEK
jgi:ribosomal protein S18 acetylase RimI-like enzyme